MRVDLTVLAIPGFIGAMGAEYTWLRAHPAPSGTTRGGDYELADTIASLTMGVGSLLAPTVAQKLLDPLTPGQGRFAKALIGAGVVAAGVTTLGDVLRRRRRDGGLPEPGTLPARAVDAVDDVEPTVRRPVGTGSVPEDARPRTPYGLMAVGAVGATALAAATAWTTATASERLFGRTPLDLGEGWAANAVAILGWDAIYYWNHRLSHESRWLWAVHVVHHSSEHYNLSTALRQPWAEGVTMSVPYGVLSLLGVRPHLVRRARDLNLIYQFWIHTEAIRSIGPLERLLNSASHHRVHHGSQGPYLDKNHGSILIVWDRLFGTFEPETEQPVYGLTRDIETYNPLRIATHEWRDIARDVATSQTWGDRFSFLLRGPGWAYDRRA